MREDVYREAMGKIKATDEFKMNLIKKTQEAEENREKNVIEMHKSNKCKKIIIPLAMAVAILICVIVGKEILSFKNNIKKPEVVNKVEEQPNDDDYEDTNAIHFSDNEKATASSKLSVFTEWGGCGFEGYTERDFKKQISGNPWNKDCDIKTLPIFKNNSYVNQETQKWEGKRIPKDELEKKVEKTAKKLNVKLTKVYKTPTKEQLEEYKKDKNLHPDKRKYFEKQEKELSGTVDTVVGEFKGGTITANCHGGINVEFSPGIKLPKKYKFNLYNVTKKEAEDTLDYLLKKYRNITNIKSLEKSPVSNIGVDNREVFCYAANENLSRSLTDKILDYSIGGMSGSISFLPDDNGGLKEIEIGEKTIHEEIGIYPIISLEKAKQLLFNGKFQTTYIDVEPSAKNIAGVELMYRDSVYDKYLMPYYRFFIEYKCNGKSDSKNYYVCYVPAVEEKYIENMPKWNGEFN